MKALLNKTETYFYDEEKDCYKCYEKEISNMDTGRELVHQN